MWPHPTPKDDDFDKLQSEVAFTLVTAYLTNLFLRVRFLKDLSFIYPYVNFKPLMWPHRTPNHNLDKLKSTLPGASKRFLYIYLCKILSPIVVLPYPQ